MNNENVTGIKETILKAAQEVFSKFGYKKTTLDDIAKYIGKGKSALYYYFKSKEEIFEAVLEFEVNLLRDELFFALEKEKNPQSKLRIYILKRMELYHQVLNFYVAIQQEYMENIPVIERVRKKYDEQELKMISEIIEEGKTRGIFVAKNVQFTSSAIIMAMKGFEYSLSKEKDMNKLEEDIDQLLGILFYGLVIRK